MVKIPTIPSRTLVSWLLSLHVYLDGLICPTTWLRLFTFHPLYQIIKMSGLTSYVLHEIHVSLMTDNILGRLFLFIIKPVVHCILKYNSPLVQCLTW